MRCSSTEPVTRSPADDHGDLELLAGQRGELLLERLALGRPGA
jgi:hypothetical protein